MNMTQNKLDLGCGDKKAEGFYGVDVVDCPVVDLVWDLNAPPYPLPENQFTIIKASHILEHIKPWKIVAVMNEVHRIAAPGCQFQISVPYGLAPEFHYDPTHTIPWTPEGFAYFHQACAEVFFMMYINQSRGRCVRGILL